MKRLAGLCMAFTFRGAQTARGNSGSYLSSQRSSAGVGSTLGSSTPASTVLSQSIRLSVRAIARWNSSSPFHLHSRAGHVGTLPPAAASRAGFGKGSYRPARQHASSSDTPFRSRSPLKECNSAPSRRTAASCLSTATSSQDVHSTTTFQTPPTYVRANGRIIASELSSRFRCFHPLYKTPDAFAAQRHPSADRMACFHSEPDANRPSRLSAAPCQLLNLLCRFCSRRHSWGSAEDRHLLEGCGGT